MGKYLPSHDLEDALQKLNEEDLQELEECSSSDAVAEQALDFIEDNNGDVWAAFQEALEQIAQDYPSQISTLCERFNEQFRKTLSDKDINQDLPDLANTIVSGVSIAALASTHPAWVPFLPVLGYFAALAVKKGIKKYTSVE